jgi:undecaprenyl-diphosphatase
MAAAILTKRMESPAVKAAIWIAAAFVVFAIGLSRVYLGVHYPTDVIGGYAAAIVWIAAVRAAYELWLRRALRPTR